MPSPFPGMNPFLERDDDWPDFHHRLIVHMADALLDQVGPHYSVRIKEHPYREEAEHQGYLEIRDRPGRELVAALELLSFANKGRHRARYLLKRAHVLTSAAHLIEIDLLRGGMPLPPPHRPECDYSVMVSRVERRPEAGFWAISLREPLPVIPVPLRSPDRDATLDLQALLHRVYDVGYYAQDIYEAPPQPPLRTEDEAWARQFVPAKP